VTTALISNGSNNAQFRFRDQVGEALTLNGDDNAGLLASGTKAFTVSASRLLVTGASPITLMGCTLYTITSKDESGNATNVLAIPLVNLSGAGSGAFYATADANVLVVR